MHREQEKSPTAEFCSEEGVKVFNYPLTNLPNYQIVCDGKAAYTLPPSSRNPDLFILERMIRKNRPIPAQEIRLLIFDLDGTLVDSRLDLANSVNAMLRHFGKPLLPNEVIASYIGDGAPMLVRRALGDPDDQGYVQQALEFFLLYYRAHKLDNTYVYPGIKESLELIRAGRNGHAIKMSVLSNKPVGPSRAIVEALGLGSYFFQVYGGNSFHTKKPDPAGVQALLQESGVPAEQTVIVGDSDVDVLTARNAGAYSIGVSYGFAPHTFVDAAPDVLVETPEEIADVFAGQIAVSK